jgi:hypothetical protein
MQISFCRTLPNFWGKETSADDGEALFWIDIPFNLAGTFSHTGKHIILLPVDFTVM